MKKVLNLFWFLLLFSCEDEELHLSPLDSVVKIQTKEVSSGDKKKIILACKTEKIFECSNYVIIADKQIRGNDITIKFSGTSIKNACLTTLGPARTELDLGVLSNGNYNIAFNGNSFENTGNLTITSSEIILDFSKQNGILILNPVYKRL